MGTLRTRLSFSFRVPSRGRAINGQLCGMKSANAVFAPEPNFEWNLHYWRAAGMILAVCARIRNRNRDSARRPRGGCTWNCREEQVGCQPEAGPLPSM
jgi:hypothetical protein